MERVRLELINPEEIVLSDMPKMNQITNALLNADPIDLKNIPKLMIPSSGGLNVVKCPSNFKGSQSLLSEDGSKFTRINF